MKPEFTSNIDVELIQCCASDDMVASAARVSTRGGADTSDKPERNSGLINYLMRERHGSPFEHNLFTFRVTAPIFVWREHMRHRVFSYNEESGRYKQLEPRFYIPDTNRPLIQVGKTGHYEFEAGSPEQYETVDESIYAACVDSYMRYEDMLAAGVAREVARMVLPVNILSTAYVTCNSRALMHFLSLRTKDDESTFKSYPQAEIEMVAREYEIHFAEAMPETYACFVKNGRVAP